MYELFFAKLLLIKLPQAPIGDLISPGSGQLSSGTINHWASPPLIYTRFIINVFNLRIYLGVDANNCSYLFHFFFLWGGTL